VNQNEILRKIPSFIAAEQAAQKGDVFCWLCASYDIEKHGHRKSGRYEFKCHECGAFFTYLMPAAVYLGMVDRRIGKKYAPRKKLLIPPS
jgi:transposase-like protein